jgi:alkylhydroperoxidase family enzyme
MPRMPARIRCVDPETAAEPVREALAAVPPLNIFKTLAHAETALRPFLRFGGAVLTQLELDPVQRELAILQVARQAEARYEWVQHVAIGRAVGVRDDQIAALEDGALESPAFSDAERAVLAFTAAVVSGPRVSDEIFGALRRHLGEREVVELLITIGDYWMLARVMTVLEVELDPPMMVAPPAGRD